MGDMEGKQDGLVGLGREDLKMESVGRIFYPDGTIKTRCPLCGELFFFGERDETYDKKEQERQAHMKACRGPEEPVGPC